MTMPLSDDVVRRLGEIAGDPTSGAEQGWAPTHTHHRTKKFYRVTGERLDVTGDEGVVVVEYDDSSGNKYVQGKDRFYGTIARHGYPEQPRFRPLNEAEGISTGGEPGLPKAASPGAVRQEMIDAAMNYVRCITDLSLTPYIKENGRHGKSPACASSRRRSIGPRIMIDRALMGVDAPVGSESSANEGASIPNDSPSPTPTEVERLREALDMVGEWHRLAEVGTREKWKTGDGALSITSLWRDLASRQAPFLRAALSALPSEGRSGKS